MRGQRSWVKKRLLFSSILLIISDFLKYFNIFKNKYIKFKRKDRSTKD